MTKLAKKALWAAALFLGLSHAALVAADKNEIEITNSKIQFSGKVLSFSCDYKRKADLSIESVRIHAKRGDKDLCLVSSAEEQMKDTIAKNEKGHLDIQLPLAYFPEGTYTLVLKITVRADSSNRILKSTVSRSLIEVAGYKGKNYELRCRLLSAGVSPFIRGQQGISQNPATWNSYNAGGFKTGEIKLIEVNNGKWLLLASPVICQDATKQGWHNFAIRCRENQIESELDRVKISAKGNNSFSEGVAGFRSHDNETAYIDDVVITDIDTGEVVFSDNFESDSLGPKWKICCGGWEISKGIPITEEISLGSFEAPRESGTQLAKTDVRKNGDGLEILVDGSSVVPLFYSIAATCNFPYMDTSYDVMHNGYLAGMKLYAISVSLKTFGKNGYLDFSILDDIMAQSLVACPDSYFILRLPLPPPPSLPAGERMKMADGVKAKEVPGGWEDTKVEDGYDASLASNSYKEYFRKQMKMLVDHMQSKAYGKNILGLLVMGGGYELNWGQPVVGPAFLLDTSKAQIARIAAGLKAKYGTVEALRKAWNDEAADFDIPCLPSLQERTCPDVAGFRNPAIGSTKRIIDFLDIYCAEPWDNHKPAFDVINEIAPNAFFGAFYGGSVNQAWGAGGGGFGTSAKRELLNHPGMKFSAGIVHYTDRRAGGVSASTAIGWESVRMHGKILMNENDLRAPTTKEIITEASYEDMAQTMRREFANTVILERNAMWYVDMGTGNWFDHPFILDEMSKELKVGRIVLENTERKNVAEVLTVIDPGVWRFYSASTRKLKAGEEINFFNSRTYAINFCTLSIEAMMRMGAPKDFVYIEDFPSKSGYKLYIFPAAFHCDEILRSRIFKLANDGAVCLLMGPAGLIDEKSASLENMERLLGMKVAFDGPAVITASMIPSSHPITAGFTGKEKIGAGAYVSCFAPVDYTPSWYRFYIDGIGSDTEILARYNNEPKRDVMAVKRVGKGAIVYSAVPITHPGVYRNIAKFAGVHVYSDSDDAFYADGNFMMIHTKDAGKKRFRLLKKVPEIMEIFTDKTVARNTDIFEVELPAKHTAVYFIGENQTFLKRLNDSDK